MSLLILSGISGAGKSTACNVLEDMGYFCIDNLIPSLLMPIAKLQAESSSIENMVVVIDSKFDEKEFNACKFASRLFTNHCNCHIGFS